MDFAELAHNWFTVLESAELLCENPDSTIMESYSEKNIVEFERKLQTLSDLYGVENYLVLEQTSDKVIKIRL